jgi:Secretion system C-terminal sorting domain
MKKFILLFGLYFLMNCQNTNAQLSMIPDGSFEDTTVDWKIYMSEGALNHWGCFIPNYFINQWFLFSTIFTPGNFNLPDNGYVRQMPKHGNFAVNLVPFIDTNMQIGASKLRSVIRSKLSNKLVAGRQYCATTFVTASEQQGFLYTNGVGMYFDNGQLDTVVTLHNDKSGAYTNATPQVQCSFLINDTINWMKIQGSFTANGTEEYITIGNFLKDSDMLWGVEPSLGGAMAINGYGQNILIDNVSLLDVTTINWLPTTYTTANADSVWVGLDQFDYADGKWYNSNMQYITTGPGFWLKGGNIEAGKKFIHEIDVCGVLRYDTTEVVVAALAISNEQLAMNNLRVYPNPTSDLINIDVSTTLIGQKIIVQDVTGKEVLQKVAKEKNVISLQGYAGGIYMVRVGNHIRKVYKN